MYLLASAFTWDGLSRHNNCAEHVSDGGIPGSTVLCELTRHFHPVLFPLAWPKTRGSEVGSRSALIVVAMSSAVLQLICATCAAVWEKKFLDQLTFGTSCSMTKSA